MSNTVAVGDSHADLCMLESAGIGILFNSQENNIKNVNYVVHGKDLRLIMDYLNGPVGRSNSLFYFKLFLFVNLGENFRVTKHFTNDVYRAIGFYNLWRWAG